MGLAHYNPKDIQIILGAIVVEGYADGTYVSVEQDNDDFELSVGADGLPTRAASNNNSGTVRFILSASSAVNEQLSALRSLDKRSGAGVVPFLMKDNNGTTVHGGPEAYIQRAPRDERGTSVGSKEWVVRVADLNQFHGRSNPPPTA